MVELDSTRFALREKLRRHANLAGNTLPGVMASPLTPTFGANVSGNPASTYNSVRQIATGVRTAADTSGAPILISGGALVTASGGVGVSVRNSWTGASFRADLLTADFLFMAGADGKFELHIPSNGQAVDLLVDGVYAWARGSKTATTGGNSHTMLVDLGAARDYPYTIRVETTGGSFYGVGARPENAILPVPTHDRLRIYTEGDSWAGPGTAATWAGMAWPTNLAHLLSPAPIHEQFGIGGTGDIATNGNFNFGQRHPYDVFLRPAPDIYVRPASTNDGSANAAALQAAVTADIVATRAVAGWSKVPIVIPGIQQYAGGGSYPTAQNAAVLAAVTALRAAGDTNVFFVDPSTWITGTGKTTSLTADGIGDWFWNGSNNHPTNRGHAYWASRLAQAIKTQVYPII
ncbi:hypothetical protein GGQ86_000357 [Xanthobacter flavus]|uniref:Uncharacterized protein n=1 Tax=Xanthobacter flavus TaxID=281 RepID=A0A9W6CNK7_XANFL|nr:hypothetical protein [Xanthobacter flavus]MDR6331910.1 hypothetical protein [Xanthobacter flavus]GLI25678.1 hypothetical protein XFLAVUS301_53520 [Xanthobacter flavus]